MDKCFSFVLILLTSLNLKAQESPKTLSYEEISPLAELPLHCIEQEYPNKLNQVLTDSSYLQGPEILHPIFYGCFDWHSSVHGHWLLANALRKFPETEMANRIEGLFDRQFTVEKVQTELAYFEPKLENSFERTYGWAWLLKLQAELILINSERSKAWVENLKPLADFIADSYKVFLPKLVYPIRSGEHTNIAFGLSLAYDYALVNKDAELTDLAEQSALVFFGNDCNCPIEFEPSGYDFLSPCLMEAELMSKVLPDAEFLAWMKKFLPDLVSQKIELIPGKVLDRTDGKLVHLDGLNFSRAWCLYSLAEVMPKQKNYLIALAELHVETSREYVVGSDYMGSHWLASFLLLAEDARIELNLP